MNKYLKRTLVVASVMIIIFSIIMLWPLPLRKVLRQRNRYGNDCQPVRQ